VSAFAPISDPAQCPIGRSAFEGYLGPNEAAWAEWSPTALVASYSGPALNLLIDQVRKHGLTVERFNQAHRIRCGLEYNWRAVDLQGDQDGFYKDGTLLPEHFLAACEKKGIPVEMRWQKGYDHSYYFVATFVDDHIAHHVRFLKA